MVRFAAVKKTGPFTVAVQASVSFSHTFSPPFQTEGVIGRKLPGDASVARIVVCRLQAFGDSVITLPLIAGLREAYPTAQIEVLTSGAYRPLFAALPAVDAVHGFTDSQSPFPRLRSVVGLARQMGDVPLFLDLQRLRATRALARLLRPAAWCAFDRYAPRPALERYCQAAEWLGLRAVPRFNFPIRDGLAQRADALLRAAGHQLPRPLVCLNPAGGWPTKQWPAEQYIALGRLLIERFGAQIVVMGTDHARAGGGAIAAALGGDAINLIGRTNIPEALAIVRQLQLMVSDDGGLMHLAWTNGIPTVALFGATRSAWSRPCGAQARWFGSEDLPCGACMSPACARGDRHCLERISVQKVMETVEEIVPKDR